MFFYEHIKTNTDVIIHKCANNSNSKETSGVSLLPSFCSAKQVISMFKKSLS